MSSLVQMELKDGTGQTYAVDIGAITAAKGKTPDGAIVAGDKLRGQVGYQVPDGVTGLQWIYKSFLGSGRAVFAIAP